MAASMTRQSGRRTSYGSHNLGQSPEAAGFGILDVLGWLLFFLTAAYVFGWLLPRRGVEFTDEGWYLYTGLMAARGQEYVTLFPQAPFHLLYALLMRLGVENLLTFRWISHALFALGLGVFLFGLSPANRLRFPVPIGMSLGLVITLFSLGSYQNGPALFLLMSLGVYFIAEDAGDPAWAKRLAWLAGAILVLTPMTNATFAPSVGLCFFCLFFRRAGRPLFWRMAASFAICFSVLFGWYLSMIGLATFFKIPSSVTDQPLLGRLWDGLSYSWQWPLFWALVSGLALTVRGILARRATFDREFLQGLANIALVLLCVVFFVLANWQYDHPSSKFALLSGFGYLPSALFFWIKLLPQLDLFLLAGFIGPAILGLAVVMQKNESPTGRRILLSALLLWVAFINKRTFGNTASIYTSILFYSAAMAALGLYAFYDAKQEKPRPGAGLALLLSSLLVVSLGVMHTLAFVHPGAVVIPGPKIDMDQPKLKGIKESPDRAEMFKGLDEGYKELGCANKTFITFRGTSFLHYYFEHKALPELEWISPIFFPFPEKRIQRALASGAEWCVFVSQNQEPEKTWDQARPTIRYLEMNSQRVIRLNPRGVRRHAYDDFTLYAGPKTPVPLLVPQHSEDRFRSPLD